MHQKPHRSGAGILFLCCGEALGCKCLCQFFVLLAAECAVPVNDVAADGESVCGGFLVYRSRSDEVAYCRCQLFAAGAGYIISMVLAS